MNSVAAFSRCRQLGRPPILCLLKTQCPRPKLLSPMSRCLGSNKSLRCRSSLKFLGKLPIPTICGNSRLNIAKRLSKCGLNERSYSILKPQRPLMSFGKVVQARRSKASVARPLVPMLQFDHDHQLYKSNRTMQHETATFIPKRTSSVQYLMSKNSKINHFSLSDWTNPISANCAKYGTESFETKLRAARVARPLQLSVPASADRGCLNITQRYSRAALLKPSNYKKCSKTLANKYVPPKTRFPKKPLSTGPRVLPTIKAKSRLVKKGEQRVPPAPVQKLKKIIQKPKAIKQNERKQFEYLLGDIIHQSRKIDPTPKKQELMKTSPLFKVVTKNMERRYHLHRGSFHKQLENPMFFKHPLARNPPPSTSGKRRKVSLAQEPVNGFRATGALMNKLKSLLYDPDDDEEVD